MKEIRTRCKKIASPAVERLRKELQKVIADKIRTRYRTPKDAAFALQAHGSTVYKLLDTDSEPYTVEYYIDIMMDLGLRTVINFEEYDKNQMRLI